MRWPMQDCRTPKGLHSSRRAPLDWEHREAAAWSNNEQGHGFSGFVVKGE